MQDIYIVSSYFYCYILQPSFKLLTAWFINGNGHFWPKQLVVENSTLWGSRRHDLILSRRQKKKLTITWLVHFKVARLAVHSHFPSHLGRAILFTFRGLDCIFPFDCLQTKPSWRNCHLELEILVLAHLLPRAHPFKSLRICDISETESWPASIATSVYGVWQHGRHGAWEWHPWWPGAAGEWRRWCRQPSGGSGSTERRRSRFVHQESCVARWLCLRCLAQRCLCPGGWHPLLTHVYFIPSRSKISVSLVAMILVLQWNYIVIKF